MEECHEQALRLVDSSIPEGREAFIAAGIKDVVWRHTGGRGNRARYFLFICPAGNFWLITKIKNRFILGNAPIDDLLALLPERLFESALNAWEYWKRTGRGTWFYDHDGNPHYPSLCKKSRRKKKFGYAETVKKTGYEPRPRVDWTVVRTQY
jgi:hypothetical protein